MAQGLVTNHGILAHQNDAFPSKTVPNLVHLLRTDIVNGDDEYGLIFLEQAFELIEISGLGGCLAPHVFFV